MSGKAGQAPVARDVVEHAAFEAGGDPPEQVGSVGEGDEHLAPVSENDLQVGVTVEGAGQDPCEGGETGLGVPSPAAGAQDHRRPPVEPAVGDVAQLL
jgi:hypothetical protein